MPKRKPKLSFKSLLSFLTLLLVAYIIYANWTDIETALSHIRETNLFVLALLVPEQMFMLFSGSQIFFSYIEARKTAKIPKTVKSKQPSSHRRHVSAWTMMRITLEANFVRQAFPSAGLSSTAYMAWRLQKYGSSSAQTSFIYLLRYFAIVCSYQLKTLFAALFIVMSVNLSTAGQTIVLLAALIALGTGFLLLSAIFLVSKKKRAIWFARQGTKFFNTVFRFLTFGRKRKLFDPVRIESFLVELHESYLIARENKHILKGPIFWGALYSIFEISSYWLVAMSLSHPEILPQIMIGEAVGSVAGAFVPYGLYELGMAGAMSALGVEVGLASLVVVITRILVLGETLLFGYIFYQRTLLKTGTPSFRIFSSEQEKR